MRLASPIGGLTGTRRTRAVELAEKIGSSSAAESHVSQR
jgi:hypothetical protein